MKKVLYVLAILVFTGCTNYNPVKLKEGSITSIKKNESKLVTKADTYHFFKDCREMKRRYYVGAIQDTLADRDSAGYMVIFPCYCCKETYEIILAYRGGKDIREKLGYDGVAKEYLEGCKDEFKKFECFAFVLPMRDPEKQEDLHAMNIDFPVLVKVYGQTVGNNWHLITKRVIKTFNDYAAMQVALVYHKLN